MLEYFVYFFTRELEWRDGPNFCLQGNIYNVNCSSEIFPYMTNLEKRYINIRFLFSFVHSQNLEIKRKKKKLHGSVVHLGVVCEHPSSGTLMVHKSSLIINWQCTNEKLWNLFFLPFCFLSTTCLVWVRRRGGVGEGSFHNEWKYIIAKQSFWIAEGQKIFLIFARWFKSAWNL